MYRFVKFVVLVLGIAACAPHTRLDPPANPIQLSITPYPYHSDRYGRDTAVEIGRFHVPAIRNQPDAKSKSIVVGYLRYLAADDAPDRAFVFITGDQSVKPIRQDLYFALREFGDVVAFSHRGFGFSPIPTPCRQRLSYPMAEKLDANLVSEATRRYAENCLNDLEGEGYPRAFLQFDEIAADLYDLKRALDVGSVYLIADSILAQAAVRALQDYPDSFDGAVLINAASFQYSEHYESKARLYDRTHDLDGARSGMAASIEALFDRLRATPASVLTSSAAGRPLLVTIGTLDLAFMIEYRLNDEGTEVRPLKYAIDKALSGDYADLADHLLETRGQLGDPGVLALLAAANSSDSDPPTPLPTINYAMGWPEVAFGSIEPESETLELIHSSGKRVLAIESIADSKIHTNSPNASDHGARIFVTGGGKKLIDTEPQVNEEIFRYLKGDSITKEMINLRH